MPVTRTRPGNCSTARPANEPRRSWSVRRRAGRNSWWAPEPPSRHPDEGRGQDDCGDRVGNNRDSRVVPVASAKSRGRNCDDQVEESPREGGPQRVQPSAAVEAELALVFDERLGVVHHPSGPAITVPVPNAMTDPLMPLIGIPAGRNRLLRAHALSMPPSPAPIERSARRQGGSAPLGATTRAGRYPARWRESR
jgi:hypothetical protein